eukprot:905236-Rhodomonas_salina.3
MVLPGLPFIAGGTILFVATLGRSHGGIFAVARVRWCTEIAMLLRAMCGTVMGMLLRCCAVLTEPRCPRCAGEVRHAAQPRGGQQRRREARQRKARSRPGQFATATTHFMRGTDGLSAYALATECPVLTCRMLVPGRSADSATAGSIALLACYAPAMRCAVGS